MKGKEESRKIDSLSVFIVEKETERFSGFEQQEVFFFVAKGIHCRVCTQFNFDAIEC